MRQIFLEIDPTYLETESRFVMGMLPSLIAGYIVCNITHPFYNVALKMENKRHNWVWLALFTLENELISI